MIDLRKTNYLLIVINIVLLITLFILFFVSFNNLNKSDVNKDINSNLSKSSSVNKVKLDIEEYKKNHDRLTSAIGSGDLSSCEKLNGVQVGNCKDIIYFNEAVQNFESSKCDLIQNSEIKRNCRFVLVD